MDSNYDCGGKPGQPHWTEEPKPGVAAAKEPELLPCPFCGIGAAFTSGDSDRGFYVICECCGVATNEFNASTKACAIEKWNNRAASNTGEALDAARRSKNARAQRGHQDAASAFVTYDGAAADLNELARYVERLERAIDAARPLSAGGEV